MQNRRTLTTGQKLLAGAVGVPLAIGATALLVTRTLPVFGKIPRRRFDSPNWRDGRFHNLQRTPHPGPEHFRDMADRSRSGRGTRAPEGPIPLYKKCAEALRTPPGDEACATWLGHTTTLVELDGVRLLTDPVWGERASPFSWVGPQRLHPPALSLDALPRLDGIILSHDHYDHLDYPTVVALSRTGVRFYVPLGVGEHLRSWGITNVEELDWWDETTVTGQDGQTVQLVATPARHFSGRAGLGGRDSSLWASWAILGETQRVFFGGDTGYDPVFETVGERLGPFDMTLLPIGAYDRAWPAIHITPEEAVQIHEDVGGGLLIPTHWATFQLALHPWDEPAERLVRAVQGRGITTHIPIPGEPVQTGHATDTPQRYWWRPLAPPRSA